MNERVEGKNPDGKIVLFLLVLTFFFLDPAPITAVLFSTFFFIFPSGMSREGRER